MQCSDVCLDQEYGQEAAEFLKELVEGKTLYASVEFRDGNNLHLTMGDNANLFVNAAIVRAGLARVERVKGAREAVSLRVVISNFIRLQN